MDAAGLVYRFVVSADLAAGTHDRNRRGRNSPGHPRHALLLRHRQLDLRLFRLYHRPARRGSDDELSRQQHHQHDSDDRPARHFLGHENHPQTRCQGETEKKKQQKRAGAPQQPPVPATDAERRVVLHRGSLGVGTRWQTRPERRAGAGRAVPLLAMLSRLRRSEDQGAKEQVMELVAGRGFYSVAHRRLRHLRQHRRTGHLDIQHSHRFHQREISRLAQRLADGAAERTPGTLLRLETPPRSRLRLSGR